MSRAEDLQRQIAGLEEQLADRHVCEEHLALRTRIVAGGHRHVVRQCTVCGQQRRGPLSKAEAAKVLGGAAAPAFDELLVTQYSSGRSSIFDELLQAKREFLELTEPDWAEHVDAMAQARTAQAGEAEAAKALAMEALDKAVDSLEPVAWYERLGFIIRHLLRVRGAAFKDPEAKPVHRFSSEPELREWLDAWIEQDFEVNREAVGRHLTEGTKVKVDYILNPRAHLVKAGFKPAPIGLEVKHLPLDGGFSPKASRFVWQAVSYTDCEFELNGRQIRLARVLLFSNMSFDAELRLLRGIDDSALSNDRAKWTALLELANHANVGVLEISGTRDTHSGWRIKFATGTYFRRHHQEYMLSDRNLFEKMRIGNF